MNPEPNQESISISKDEYALLKSNEDLFYAIFEESHFVLVINPDFKLLSNYYKN